MMKPIIPFLLLVLFSSGVFAQVGTLTVTNVESEAGSGLTEIEYEFTGDDDVYNISATVSFNNGDDFEDIPDADLTGDVSDVIPGGPYSITWDGMASFPETYSDETIIKITANSTWQCGDNITFTYNEGTDYEEEVTYGTVWSGGLCWMDRNLGATQVATANDDHLAYGDLFQWGRGDDGHQVVTWTSSTTGDVTPTTTMLSTTDVPGHDNFITVSSSPWDWLSGQNDNLWQGGADDNNPCPPGWRVPTKEELYAELGSWGTDDANATGALDSPLKLPVAGHRSNGNGSLGLVGSYGTYWSSTVAGSFSRSLRFDSTGAGMYRNFRAYGGSVRCLKDE